MSPAPPVLAEVVRSGLVESRHRGSLVLLAADGSVAEAYGDAEAPVFPRSAVKPLQAAAMVRCGLEVDDELLALAAASHGGEPFHLDAVRRLLARADLGDGALQTPPDLPLDDEARLAWLRAGSEPARIAMNCSGKHAAMLVTSARNDWDLATYCDPHHPLQMAVRAEVEQSCGEPVAATGVDGCGAPVLAVSLTGLARGLRACVTADAGTPERRVADAMRAHPGLVGGTRRPVSVALRAVPGLLVKDGAEAVWAGAMSDGRAFAVKVGDGGERAIGPVVAEVMRRWGVAPEPGVDEAWDRLAHPVVLGGGEPVGEVRVVRWTETLGRG